ncbi:MAG: TRAP transporter large permease subunit [Burkholderiaceae bacterium]|nr:TRAP transporter large permease subunit [Burkholderiaceae bacterium]
MELLFLILLIGLMAFALGSGFPVAFALPGSAILTIAIAAGAGYLFAGNMDAYFAQGGPSQWLSAGVTNLRGVYWEVERDTLIAIPLFVFMGIMLQRSKIAEDLLVTMARLFGPIPGGLGISVVFVGALLAATTGIVGATVVAMGLISLPAMLRNNYSKSLATGTIAASGTLGQIIPPSIVLIILADQLSSAVDQAGTARKALYKVATGQLSMPSEFEVGSTSAGEMFLGALVPGLVLVGLYMAYILVFAMIRPQAAPAVRSEGRIDVAFLTRVFVTLVPPLLLIFLVLGSILSGIATVNQAGAIGAAGALLMAGYRLREGQKRAYYPAVIALLAIAVIAVIVPNFDTNIKNIRRSSDAIAIAVAVVAVICLIVALVWSGYRALKFDNTLQGVMIETAKTTSLVFIILLGAAMLTAAFRAFGGEDLVREFLVGMPGGFWAQFIIVMAVIFILGFFIDFIEIAVVVVPIVAPILLTDPAANISAVWLGVMIGLNIQTSFLTPPFGFALFYLRGVAPPEVRTLDMYRGVIAFISLQVVALVIVGLTPSLVNYLPNRMSLLSDTAPPPRNPRLQYCLEEYVTDRIRQDGTRINEAIATAGKLDLNALPKPLANDVRAALSSAQSAFKLLDTAQAAEQTVMEKAVAYRPVHQRVRALEKDIHRHGEEIKNLERRMSSLRDETEAGRRAALQARVGELTRAQETLRQQIPADWKATYDAFSKYQREERLARVKYRRAADRGFEPIAEIAEVLGRTSELEPLRAEITQLTTSLVGKDPKVAQKLLSAVSTRIDAVPGSSDISASLAKVKRILRSSSPDAEKIRVGIEATLTVFDRELAWRKSAAASVLPGLRVYTQAVGDTIGARVSKSLTRDQALYIASCQAGHRDVSLSF